MKLSDDVKLYGALGLLGLAVMFIVYREVKNNLSAAADFASTKLNPASSENLIYDGLIGGVGRAVTGDEDFSLGGYIYDVTHPGTTDLSKPFCTNFLGVGCPDAPPAVHAEIPANDIDEEDLFPN